MIGFRGRESGNYSQYGRLLKLIHSFGEDDIIDTGTCESAGN